jgi:ATP-binding cassette subfamily B protein
MLSTEPLPTRDDSPALPAMWRALKRGYAAEPFLISLSFGLALLAAVPDALIALL